jgi:hypothetical protein
MPDEEVQTPTVETVENTEAPVPGGLEDAPNLTHEDVFNFDPFAVGAVPDRPPVEGDIDDGGAPVAQEAVVSTPPVVPGVPVSATTPLVQTPTPGPTVEQLSIENRALAEQNRQILEMLMARQSPQVPVPTAPPKAQELPNYMFDIPPQIQNLLQSEDPVEQSRGLSALIAGMAKTVHSHVRSEYEERLKGAVQEARQTFASDTQRAGIAQQVFNDFYGTYPQFNRPELRDLVANATKSVVEETKASQWSAGLRDKIAERVSQIFSSVSGTPQPTASVSAAPVAVDTKGAVSKAPPRMRGTSVRPTPETPPEPGSQDAHIFDVLHGVN